MKVSDLLISINPLLISDSIGKAVSIFLSDNINILPVIDERNQVVGTLTLQDTLAALQNNNSLIQEIGPHVSRHISQFSLDDKIDKISVESLPAVVLDEKGALAGVITEHGFSTALQSMIDESQAWFAETSKELKSLKDINKELEAIIDSSYDGIWVMDGNGLILRANKATERISGRPTSAFVGKNIRELVASGQVRQSAALLVMEKRERVTINQTRNGKAMLLITGTPVFDDEGNLFRIVTNNRDISELVHLRDQLLKEQEQSIKYMAELVQLRGIQNKAPDFVFRSDIMQRVVELSSKVAEVNSTVMITGESGTGKEKIARLIHWLGRGGKKPFITISCGATPDSLLESELFGYVGGAFTGAKKEGKPGMFELAHTGTLFIDEIGELPLAMQVKLLRVLQEREVCRLGATKSIPVNVRIITATNKDLSQMLQAKTFREDLYYRLMVVPIYSPPLRERREDIPPLVYHFIDEFNSSFGFKKTVSPQVIDRLVNYAWPGNVRELKNVVERMIVMSQGNEVTHSDLPGFFNSKRRLPKAGTRLKDAVIETETFMLAEAYKEYGSWQKVAEVLGIDYTTVYRKVSRYKMMNQH